MHANTYYYAGGFDDWFYEKDSLLTMEDLISYFKFSILANGGDSAADVDDFADPGSVMLKATSGVYAQSGQLFTIAAACSLAGTGRVSVTSEYTAGITAISLVETSTSDDRLAGLNGRPLEQAGNCSRLTENISAIELHYLLKTPVELLNFLKYNYMIYQNHLMRDLDLPDQLCWILTVLGKQC